MFIAIMGQISSAVVAELKKLSNWNAVSTSQNPFYLIQMFNAVCQTGGFNIPADSQLEGMKQYQRFAKFE